MARIFMLVYLALIPFLTLYPQKELISGKGEAIGTDFLQMRIQALNNARADALYKAGVFMKSSGISLQSESSTGSIDFYSKFAESSSRGLILEEKIIQESDPVRLKSGTIKEFQMEIEIQALVGIQNGSPDESFEVVIETDKEAYQEGEPVTLKVHSTKDGYLTILNVYNDSLSVICPNSLDKENSVKSNKVFVFPSHEGYELQLEVPLGKKESVETFLAIVTRNNTLFPNLAKLEYAGDQIKLKQEMLATYARWLYKIPIDQRTAGEKVVRVFKKNN